MAEIDGLWKVVANGHEAKLQVSAGANGALSGTYDGVAVTGFWDGTSKTLTFIRVNSTTVNTYSAGKNQVFTGFFFVDKGKPTLAGSFEAFKGTGAAPQRSTFGWVASKS
jgi:hypothetical protein